MASLADLEGSTSLPEDREEARRLSAARSLGLADIEGSTREPSTFTGAPATPGVSPREFLEGLQQPPAPVPAAVPSGPPSPAPESPHAASPSPVVASVLAAAPRPAQGPSRPPVEVSRLGDADLVRAAAGEPAPMQAGPTPAMQAASAATGKSPDDPVTRMLADRLARDQELRAAQREAGQARLRATGENAIKAAFTNEPLALQTERLAAAGQPVKDFEARQVAAKGGLELAKGEQGFKQDIDMHDASGPLAQAMQKAGILPPGLPPSAAPAAAEIFKARLVAETAGKHQEAETQRTQLEIAGRASEGAKNRANARELAMLKDKEEKKGLTPEERKTMVAYEATPEIMDELEAAQKEVGPVTGALGKLGLHIGAEGRYSDLVNAYKGQIAQEKFPGARGPAAAKMVEASLPSGLTPAGRASAQFAAERRGTMSRRGTMLEAAGAAHPGSREVAAGQERLAADVGKYGTKGGGAAPAGGQRIVRSPSGSRHPLAPGAAVPAGWTLE